MSDSITPDSLVNWADDQTPKVKRTKNEIELRLAHAWVSGYEAGKDSREAGVNPYAPGRVWPDLNQPSREWRPDLAQPMWDLPARANLLPKEMSELRDKPLGIILDTYWRHGHTYSYVSPSEQQRRKKQFEQELDAARRRGLVDGCSRNPRKTEEAYLRELHGVGEDTTVDIYKGYEKQLAAWNDGYRVAQVTTPDRERQFTRHTWSIVIAVVLMAWLLKSCL